VTLPEPLLEISDVTLEFSTRGGIVSVLDGISFRVEQGETLGIVGESGSGKSVTALAILGLLDPAARIVRGSIRYKGRELLGTGEATIRSLRGSKLCMIFQNPRAALNPIVTVGKQLVDVLQVHRGLSRSAARREAIGLLDAVKIPDPRRRVNSYPFEFSGGMCQRVMIALALACSPDLLIADEPTTGLDVTTQASIMALIRGLVVERGMSTIFITHDLALAAENCQRIAVMHAGQLVEIADSAALFHRPIHPYTQSLLAATPTPTSSINSLPSAVGIVPDLTQVDLPPCRYSRRCVRYLPTCDRAEVPVVQLSESHLVACWRAQ
jgi:peptide/nickel transport system ATP-binding protein